MAVVVEVAEGFAGSNRAYPTPCVPSFKTSILSYSYLLTTSSDIPLSAAELFTVLGKGVSSHILVNSSCLTIGS